MMEFPTAVRTSAVDLLELGRRAPEFRDLLSVDGKRLSLSSFDDAPLLVVIFSCNGCPTVKASEDRIIALQEAYGPQGVRIVAINSNNSYLSPADTYPEMVKRAREKGFNFPYLKDDDGSVGRSYGAISTPHAFLFDRERHLQYQGRIDDSRDPARVTVRDLQNAIDDLLAGRPVRVAETKPFGCAIVR
jgi:thiol-disulfide isomerase/thioredoxin